MKARLFAVLAGLALLTSMTNLYPAAEAQSKVAYAKLSPWVIEHTQDGQTAEFLVVLSEQADLSGADQLETKEEKGRFVYNVLIDKAQATQKPMLEWLKANGIEHQSFYVVNMVWVKGDLKTALALAARSEVARIEGNPLIHNRPVLPEAAPTSQPSAIEAIEPGVNYTRAPLVWSMGYTGQGAVVGGADTGYLWNHNALKPHYRGWNGATADHNYNWHDSIHDSTGNPCGNDSTQPCDDNGHGTHTVGTATGDDGAGNQIGMAPGAKWIGCRNMNSGDGTPARYAECFQFFLAPYPLGGTPAQGDPTKAPDVTTNSWGCPASEGCNSGTWGVIQSAIQANRTAGIVTVVAAGNSGSSCSTVSDPPSFFAESFTVGALTTGTDTIASFSSRGPVIADGSNRRKPDISAPGTSTRSAYPNGGRLDFYTSLSGTSMATPHVAGAVALVISAQPKLRGQVSTIEGILEDSALHLSDSSCGSSGWPNNKFGYGRLDVKAAADMALTVASPQSMAFTAPGGEGRLVVSAPSTSNWSATTSDSWITLINSSGTGNAGIDFIVRGNPNASVRTGTITLARRTYVIRQEAFGTTNCSFELTPTSQNFLSLGGTGSLSVTTLTGCVWNARSSASWVTITSDPSGAGNGSVTFTVAPNATGSGRKATINVAGRVFSIKQK